MKEERVRVRKLIIGLPSAVTLLNLSLGFLSLLATIRGHYSMACWLIILAAFIDGLDGVIARSTKSNSAFGTELDSLVDAVSFATSTGLLLTLWGAEELGRGSAALGFIFLSAGVLRLARFNILQGKQKEHASYLGLTVPSASVFIVSLILINFRPSLYLSHQVFFSSIIALVSFLMVSQIPYPNFIKKYIWRRITLPRGLLFGVIIFAIYLHPAQAIFVLSSLNVSSGPLKEAWRLLRKLALAKSGQNEAHLR